MDVMPNGFNYPAMLKEIYKSFIEDLKEQLPELHDTVKDFDYQDEKKIAREQSLLNTCLLPNRILTE